MNIKLRQIIVVVNIMFISGSSDALSPTSTPDIEIFMSGSSILNDAIYQVFDNHTGAPGFCVSDANGNPVDLDVFKDNVNPANPGRAHTAYFCTLDTTRFPEFSISMPRVLFHKTSYGGSHKGLNPLIDEVAIDAMNIYNGNCAAPDLARGENFWRCDITPDSDNDPLTGNLLQTVPDLGISVFNPEMYVGVNTPYYYSPVSARDVADKLVVKAVAAFVFAVPVSTNLRDALQEVQFPGNTICTTYTADPNAVDFNPLSEPRESEACMPSLSKRQVASIMTGKVRNWSVFKLDVKGSSVALTDAVTRMPDDTKVRYCRGIDGADNQVQVNAQFLNYPCFAGAATPVTAPNSVFYGPIVVENSGSGNMTQCLNDANNGAGYSQTAWALGIHNYSTAHQNIDLIDDFRFIKIDGVAPTLENAANGKYNGWVESTIQWRRQAYNGPTANKLKFIEEFSTLIGRPDILADLNKQFQHTWGQAGFMAVSTNFAPAADGVLDLIAPVIPYSHAVKGNPDNCVVPVINGSYQSSQL